MDFSIRKAPAPELDREASELAERISRGLSYDDDLGLVKYADEKKIGVYFAPFSVFLALGKLGRKPRAFGAVGLIERGGKYVLTRQAKKGADVEGMGRMNDVPGRRALSFQGFAIEWENDPIECAYAELNEELGMDAGDVKEIRRELVVRENEILLAALFSTELDDETILRLSSLAIDRWEVERIEFLGKEDGREFLKGGPYLEIFDRLVK